MSKCSPPRPPPSSGLESRAVDHALSRLLAHDRIRAARHHIERTDEGTLARQAALSAIPAPTGAEGRRAAHVAELFRTIGLCDVMVDHAGNVHGWLGKNGERSAPVVLAAHLDTVFRAEVDVAVERRGQPLDGPGNSGGAPPGGPPPSPPNGRAVLLAPWGGWGAAGDSPRSRRRRGSIGTGGARIRAPGRSSMSGCARRWSAPPTTRTAAAPPARRRCA